MTFEEWWEKNKGPNSSFQSRDWAEKAWYASKEDSKVLVIPRFVESFHGGVDFSYWQLFGLPWGVKSWHFASKSASEHWAVDNGYRLK